MCLCSVHSGFQWYKNYKSRPRNARVVVENNVASFFFRTRCTLTVNDSVPVTRPPENQVQAGYDSGTGQCLHGLAPTYLADDCLAISAIAGRRHLWFARTGLLSVPKTTITLGMRIFAVAGPVIWNSLPPTLRTATLSTALFAKNLKAHLFGCWFSWSTRTKRF